MAGQIRKGFFFYFGLFVLLLVATFLVCVVVMIFNPGKSVIWMQYFTDNKTYEVVKTTEENEAERQDIVWANVETLEIDCSYANVTIERNNNNAMSKDGLYIRNNAKGFTVAANAVPFKISATYEGSKLLVSVTEPEGFLFFSKSIDIVLHASSLNNNRTDFAGMNLIVKTTDGDVNLGGSFPTYNTDVVKLNSVQVKTGKGDIRVTDNFDSASLGSVKLETQSGDILSSNKTSHTSGGSALTGLSFNCDTTLSTVNGKISLDALQAANLTISCERGTVVLDHVWANDISFISCVQGNYILGEIEGNLVFDSEDFLLSPNIEISLLQGDFTLSTKQGQDSSPDIEIGEIDGKLIVFANKGNLAVGKAKGAIEIRSEGSLAVNVGVADANNNAILVVDNNGRVRLGFLGTVSNNVTVRTVGGNIAIDVTNAARFSANLWKNNELTEKEMLPDGNISVNIGENKLRDENPRLQIGVGGNIEIFTNAHVDFKLI